MNIYVDESGNLGAKDRYFVIALFVPTNINRIKNIIKRHCAKNNIAELKASETTFPDKQNLVNKIIKLPDYFISYIVLDKKHITSQRLWKNKNLLFNYLCKHLMRRLVKNCREDINIIMDEHTIKVASGNTLKEYIQTTAYGDWGYKNTIGLRYLDSKSCKLIQASDLVANIIFAKYNYEKLHKTHLYDFLSIRHSVRFPYQNFGI